MVLGRIANSIFGTPEKDKADWQQANIMHNQFNRGNDLHNKELTSKIMKELSIMNYRKKLSNDNRKGIHAQNQYFKTSEAVRRVAATKKAGPTGYGSRTAGRNQDLMLLSQLNKAENIVRYTKGEAASGNAAAALTQYQSDMGKANALGGVGVSAKLGVQYKDETVGNVMKLGKLAISVASGKPPMDLFGQVYNEETGQSSNASWWEMMTKQTTA